jgi:hypothetical protein
MSDHRQKPIDRAELVSYLSRSFSRAVHKAVDAGSLSNKAVRTTAGSSTTATQLYDHQVSFAYLIDHIERGPAYIAPKFVQEANELIASIEATAA